MLLILSALVGIMVVGQTVSQSLAGIVLSAGEWAAFVGMFVVMSLIAVWLLALFFRHIEEPG